MDHESRFAKAVGQVRHDGRGRAFAHLERIAGRLPSARNRGGPGPVEAARQRPAARHGIRVQPINYPRVPRGTERLRITPTPYHDERLMDDLAAAPAETWEALGIGARMRLAAE